MDAQDTAFECYPTAEARQEPAIFAHGDRFLIGGGYWAIFAGADFDADELGHGRTENEAWTDAADQLESQAA